MTTLQSLRSHWNRFAASDPEWAILTCPGTEGGRWSEEAFMRTGIEDIARLMTALAYHKISARRNRALDFGCGVGRLSVALADHFEHVDGTDISSEMIAQARSHPRVTYHVNEGNLSEFPSGAYDLVYSFITLQHIPRPYSLEYIREFVRLLSPNGVAAFQVPTAINSRKERLRQRMPWLAAAISYAKRGIWANMEAHALTRDDIEQAVHSAGARIRAVDTGLGNETIPSAFYYVTH